MPNYPAWMQQGGQTNFMPLSSMKPKDVINQRSMIGQNPAANYQYNVPTAYQMFPLLAQNPIIQGLFANMQAPQQMQYGQGMNMGGQGLFGAGRFLGGQGLLGNSTSTTGV